MKKKLILIIIIIVFLIIGIGSAIIYFNDNLRFKLSYEYINYLEYNNGKKIEISIPFNNKIKYVSESELLDILESGTGIVYLGYNTCPWCRNVIPVLIDTIKKNNIDTLYYADIHNLDIDSIRDELYEVLDSYLEYDSEGNKGLAVPDVYFIKNGKIIGQHRGAVDSYNNPYMKMTTSQKKELTNIYENFIKEMK